MIEDSDVLSELFVHSKHFAFIPLCCHWPYRTQFGVMVSL